VTPIGLLSQQRGYSLKRVALCAVSVFKGGRDDGLFVCLFPDPASDRGAYGPAVSGGSIVGQPNGASRNDDVFDHG